MLRELGEAGIDLEALFNVSPNAYVLFDPSFVILGCNDAYLRVVGRTCRDQIVGRYLFDAFPSDPASDSYRIVKSSLDRVTATKQPDYIPIAPYDTSAAGEPRSMRFWSATHIPVFDREGSFRFILQHTVDVTELHRLREGSQLDAIVEAGFLMRAQHMQRQSQRLRDMFAQAPGFVGILTGPDHVFQIANEAYIRLVGGRELVGKSVREALPEVVQQGFVELLDQVRRSGKPYIGQGVRVSLRQMPDGEEERFVDFVYQPLRDEDGSIYGIYVQGNDVTEQKRAEDHLAMVAQENAHRVKNSLAVAQAVVAASLRETTDIVSARRSILNRLQILAATQAALVENQFGASEVSLIVSTVMEPHQAVFGRIEIAGPAAPIEPSAAQGLALILHELATNAVKYGALSRPTGRIEIFWTVRADEQRIDLLWRERGGPEVVQPMRRGFGTKLIERALPNGPKNKVDLTFADSGVSCTISMALSPTNNEASPS